MTEAISIATGVGVGDLQMAAAREVRRIMREAGGDRHKAVQIGLRRACELGFISEEDLRNLGRLCEVRYAAVSGRQSAERSHAETRRIYDEMLAGGRSSPAALAFASGSVGGFVSVDEGGEPGVVYKASSSNWQDTLGNAGILIGGAIGGAPGAAIGAAIGQVSGKIVDECLDED